MAHRYQFINYSQRPVTVHIETQDRIELCQLVDSTPADAPEEPQTLHGPGEFDLDIPGGTIFGFFSQETAEVHDPGVSEFVMRTTEKVPWPQPPPLAPSSLAHVEDFETRYDNFLAPAGQQKRRAEVEREACARRDNARRNVRAILIAGDDIGQPGRPAPHTVQALDTIERDLRKRFCHGDVRIDRPGKAPTKGRVLRAFERMKDVVTGDDLLVVMFAGHGSTDVASDTQSWILTNGELFSDRDLASALSSFPRSIDTVVISDCCFGAGAFETNDQLHTDVVLQQHSKILVRALEKARTDYGASDQDWPMVCISAASKQDEVLLAHLADLAVETVRAAVTRQSYSRLAARFDDIKAAGRAFQVDARPPHRLNDLVLSRSSTSTTPSTSATSSTSTTPSTSSTSTTSSSTNGHTRQVPQVSRSTVPLATSPAAATTAGWDEILDLLRHLLTKLLAPGPAAGTSRDYDGHPSYEPAMRDPQRNS